MRFKTKLIIIYTSFLFLVALLLGMWYQYISFNHYKTNEYQNNELLSQQLTNQLDETIKPMHFVTSYLLSDMDVLSAIRVLSGNIKDVQLFEEFKNDAIKTIQLNLRTYYLYTNFRRVIFFNQSGIVIANNNTSELKLNNDITIDDLNWIHELKENDGTPVFLRPHLDDWSLENSDLVISIVKKIQGDNLGYIEVQKNYSDLEELLNVENKELKIVAFSNNNSLLYSNFNISEDKIEELLKIDNTQRKDHYNPFNKKEILSNYTSKETGITLFVIENIETIKNKADYIVLSSFIIASIFLIISGIFVFISSYYLNKPIKSLVALMENTQLENMNMPIDLDSQHDEFKVLNKTYNRLLSRLNEAMIREKKLTVQQLQAQFDLLQTQLNPHFLYNVLNVMSNRGMKSGDEKICDMCSSLANMLRYATSTKQPTATIEEEMNYLEQYFYLLKERYSHKIEYVINIDEEIKNQIVPKVFFQQFIENSIIHGFKDMLDTMQITIKGYVSNSFWYVKIIDNGTGFEQETIIDLQQKIDKIHKKIMVDLEKIELEIGGMGIVNAYSRMVLFYNEKCIFKFGNNKQKGAYILLGAPMKTERDDANV